MFKLLPEKQRIEVKREYFLRRMIVIICSIILVLVVALVGLLPSYLLSFINGHDVLERTRLSISDQSEEESQALSDWLDDLTLKLKVLDPKLDKVRPSVLIEKMLLEKTEGVHLTNIVWAQKGTKVSLIIAGLSDDRQQLITFQNNLNLSERFSDVNSPVSNLASEIDLDFQITLIPSNKP